MANDTKLSSFRIQTDIYNKICKLARFNNSNFNAFLQKILQDYIDKNADVLKIIERAENEVSALKNSGGANNG